MLLQDKENGALVEVLDVTALINPVEEKIRVSGQQGEEEQPPEEVFKNKLVFPSGEDLPRCWLDANYRASLN
jgi:hypothetical protein